MALTILTFLAITLGVMGLFHFLPRYAQPARAKARRRIARERQGE